MDNISNFIVDFFSFFWYIVFKEVYTKRVVEKEENNEKENTK